jgi:hypothetical protein
MKIYIPVCDKYVHCIPALKYTIDKYWSSDLDITVLGYKEIETLGWKFVSLGVDRGPNYFCEDMYNFFKTIEDKHFIYLNEDFFIMSKVNVELLDKLFDYIKDNNVGRIGLTKDIESRNTPNDRFGYDIVEDNIIKLKQNANYRTSLICSVWNREYFLSHLSYCLDADFDKKHPWFFEIHGSEHAINDGVDILGSRDYHVVQLCHLYHRGDLRAQWRKDAFSDEVLSDIDTINIKNIIFKNK